MSQSIGSQGSGAQGSGNVGRFAVPRRRFLVRKRAGQRQTTKRPYSSVLLAPPVPPADRSPALSSGHRAANASPRPAILGRSPARSARSSSLNAGATTMPSLSPAHLASVLPSPQDASPAAVFGLTPGVTPGLLPSVEPSPVITSPVPTPAVAASAAQRASTPAVSLAPQAAATAASPIKPLELKLASEPEHVSNKKSKQWQPAAKKKSVRGSSSEAKLVLRQVEMLVAERRASEDDLELHESCKKFVQELALELSDQAQIIDENVHLLKAHRHLGEQKRQLKTQLLEVQQQRSLIAADLAVASTELEEAREVQALTTDLSQYLYQLEGVQHKAIKRTAARKESPDYTSGNVCNLAGLTARAARNSNHLAVLKNANSQLENLLKSLQHPG